ncbi:MAG: hypothetical protein HYV13_04070 [Candidatus Doudnabacteria bacterium]|nr:hypothetical protein [Candidatus Doudnabacteria bacterium]
MDLIATLEKLEPVFMQAGELACKMQKGVKHHNKFNSGNPVKDIVTEADLAVQELLLEAMSKTDLVNCRLMAEEKTPLASKFNEQGRYYLAIDPIDGTAIYAKNGKYFSQIISLHDGKNFLYRFVRYPKLNWTLKIVNNNYSILGETPTFSLPTEAQRTIVYWVGNPEKNISEELLIKLKNKGLCFAQIETFGEDVSSIVMFACNKAAGVYEENINVYDGLTEYNIALAKGFRVYSDGPRGRVDLSNIKKEEIGLYYPGYCLELNKVD